MEASPSSDVVGRLPIAVVTGANSTIGKAIALEIAELGMQVIAVDKYGVFPDPDFSRDDWTILGERGGMRTTTSA